MSCFCVSLHIKQALLFIVPGGAGKSLTRPGGKQAGKNVRDARDFYNIEMQAVIKISLFPSWSG
jgi:hypothetical protein